METTKRVNRHPHFGKAKKKSECIGMNVATTEDWKFASRFDGARREWLESVADFAEVVALVKNSIDGIGLAACYGREPELQACIQPVYTLSVSEHAFDAFFNSPVGYRACYLREPAQGQTANFALIEALLERLIAVADKACLAELASINLNASLRAASSKVWLHEDDFPFESLTRDLAIEPWESAANSGVRKANWGLCAPIGNRLQIKGALLDTRGNEVVPREKILRRDEIRSYGYS